MDERIAALRRILDESNYTVALCGSGMMTEGGVTGIKAPERAYEIEKKYGASPEYIFTSAYYNTRPEKFFNFYKEEILKHIPEAAMLWQGWRLPESSSVLLPQMCIIRQSGADASM